MPPVDPLKNLKELIELITKNILIAFPVLVAVLTFILFAIVALLLLIFQGGTIISP